MENKESIQTLLQLMDEARKDAKFHRDMIEKELLSDGIDLDKVLDLLKETNEDPKAAGYDNKKIIDAVRKDPVSKTEGDEEDGIEMDEEKITSLIKGGIEAYPVDETGNISQEDGFVSYLLKSGKDVLKMEKSMKEIEEDSNKAIKEYSDQLTSKQYDLTIEHKIEVLKKNVEVLEEKDTYESRQCAKLMRKNIRALEHRYDLEFLFDRIADPKLTQREIDADIRGFMNEQGSSIMMNKFNAVVKKFKLDPDTYKYLFNIEENFLEEKYLPFNNLFLSIVMRYIGFADTTQEQEIKSLINGLVKLNQHKFYSMEIRDTFLNAIRRMLDYFLPYEEKFKEKNVTYPEHPKRKAKDLVARNKFYVEGAKRDIKTATELYSANGPMDMESGEQVSEVLEKLIPLKSEDETAETDPLDAFLSKLSLKDLNHMRDIAVSYIKDIEYKEYLKKKEQEEMVKEAKKMIKDVTDRYAVSHNGENARVLEVIQDFKYEQLKDIWSTLDDAEFEEKLEAAIKEINAQKAIVDENVEESNEENEVVEPQDEINEEVEVVEPQEEIDEEQAPKKKYKLASKDQIPVVKSATFHKKEEKVESQDEIVEETTDEAN